MAGSGSLDCFASLAMTMGLGLSKYHSGLTPHSMLMRYHGDIYRRYRERVPGLVPLPWKYLRDSDVQFLAGDRE
jgi:hypothetical protein